LNATWDDDPLLTKTYFSRLETRRQYSSGYFKCMTLQCGIRFGAPDKVRDGDIYHQDAMGMFISKDRGYN
jgi:hypothetical protein